jgi:purine-binding chemotaxis protein CheW
MASTDSIGTLTGFAADGNQYLTFRLGEEEYGLDILQVQEIKGFSRITPMPNVPRHIKGVLNLRGTVVPVMDLRTRFDLRESTYDKFTVIIIVNVGRKVIGLVVDAVSDVVNIRPEDVEATPDLGASVDISFLHGMAKAADRLVLLLDIPKLIRNGDLAVPEKIAS